MQQSSKNILVGCHYRHHTDLKNYNSSYLENLTKKLGEQNNKHCVLMGDFNVNLLACDDHNDTENFYDILSSFSFQPLILQPTRVTSSSSTLIDNIFIDQLGIKSTGGNIVTSISDHFPQFAFFDLNIRKIDSKDKYARDFNNFNDREFEDEMNSIQWNVILNDKSCDEGVNLLFSETNKVFDCMAPIKKVKKKKQKNTDKPWITQGLLKSIRSKNKIHKKFLSETDAPRKKILHDKFKTKRNILVNIIRKSEKMYYKTYFDENRTNIKKTWEGIKRVINLNKKSHCPPNTSKWQYNHY